jgi:hypothetical protein
MREATFDDYERIAALQVRNGLTPRPYVEWAALWERNPAYRAGMPLGWIVETQSGEIGGYIGNLPLLYRLNGRDLRAATVYSWATDPQSRGYSLALLDRFVRQPGVDLIVCTTPNAAASRAFEAFRFAKVPVGRWDKCWFWITGYRGFARSALRKERVWMGDWFSYPLGAVLSGRDAVLGANRYRATEEFEWCSSFDSRFEQFWQDMNRENPSRLLAARDRETLAWHFGAALQSGDAWILAASRGGRLVAYAIFDRLDHVDLGLKRIRFVDFQALPGHEGLAEAALARAIDFCREHRVHVLENAGCWLSRWGIEAPYRRAVQTWGFYYKASNAALARELQDPAVWAPSAFDGDASV